MAVNLVVPEGQRAQWQAFLATAIPPAVGAEAFARALASRRARVVIASYDVVEALRLREASAAISTSAEDSAPPEAQPTADAKTRPDLSSAYEAPESEVERRLAAIWSDLLGVDPVGRQDDFFELGGHSLLATRVLARVQQSFGVRLELRDVFDAPTIGRLGEKIARNGDTRAVVDEEREEIEF